MEKHYTIPTVDISADTSLQTVVDREEGVYLGHSTSALLADGKTILLVYPKNHGNGHIVLKRSDDGGITWSERLPVPQSWSTSMETPAIFRTLDKDGGDHLILFSGLRPIRIAHSEDNGVTWSELTQLYDSGAGGIVAMGDICQTAPGCYFALFHDDGRFMHDDEFELTEVYAAGEGNDTRTKLTHRYKQPDGSWSQPQGHWLAACEREGDVWRKIHEMKNARSYSDGHFVLYQTNTEDGGRTWSEPKAIPLDTDAQICEPAIIRSPDGSEITVLLRENSRKYNSFKIVSRDNGVTWSQPIELPAALTGDRHCARYLKDGRLFISFRDMTHISPTKGDWVAWVGTYDDIANCREGQYRVRLMHNTYSADCGYPAVDVLPDGTIVTETYGHWTEGEQPYIMSVRVTPQQLDELAKQAK